MSEVLLHNYEQSDSTEKQNNTSNIWIDDLDSTENYISRQAEAYKKGNIWNEEWLAKLDNLLLKQSSERQTLKDKISSKTNSETKE